MPASLRSFIEAASDTIARAIASVQREALRERELREAQFAARMAELETRIASVSEIERRLAERLASLKDGEPGRDGVDGQNGVDGRDGTSVALDDVVTLLTSEVTRVCVETAERILAAWERPQGKEPDPAALADMIQRAVDALPPAQAGKDADPELVASLVDEKVRAAIEALPPAEKGERGDPGPAGELPKVSDWQDRVHYHGDVVSFEGALYQASRDTGHTPPHEDWTCIVRAGRDGRSPKVRTTWSETAEYSELDIVALNGAGFIARRDNPGPCPGEGWQLIASQGKQGKPGERGQPGIGLRGEPGRSVVAVHVNDEGLLSLTNGDGSTVDCDLYPVLSRLG